MPCGEGQPAGHPQPAAEASASSPTGVPDTSSPTGGGSPRTAAQLSTESTPTGGGQLRTVASQPLGVSEHFPLLVGVHRRSLCCAAHVYHPAPASARRLGAATTLLCANCHHFARFEVVNAFGDRIWPVPKWFVAPPPTPSRVIYGADLPTYNLALPNRILRTLFR